MQLAIEILKQEKTIEQIALERETGRRTIQRRINTLEKSPNPIERRVYDLCKAVSESNSRKGGKLPEELARKIGQVLEEVEEQMLTERRSIDSNVDEKRAELLELERKYNELCQTMSKQDAAIALGYTPNRIFKLLNELYRIEIERAATEQSRDFRQRLRAEVDGISRKEQEAQQAERETQKGEERE